MSATPAAQAVIQGTTSASTTISVTPVNAFGTTTSIALDCVSPPSGITCGTGTTTVAQAGSIGFNLPSGLAGGLYTINVRGTGGGYTSTIPVNVQVLVPSFSLASSPAAATVVTGTTAAVLAISVNATGGFSNSTPVTLTCPSAPAGISCSAATGTGAQAANLGVALPSGLANGTYTLTVQGSGGGLTNTVLVPIQVAPPGNYSLGLSPNAATIARGTTSVSTTVSVIGTGGWPSGQSVALTCPNAPAGITCGAATATGAQAGSLTLTVPSTIAAGNYTINVSGNGGGVVQGASYGLTVTSTRSMNLPGSQAPTLNLTGTSNLASLTQWRMEFRMHGYASTSTYSGVFEIGAFPNANAWGFLSSGTLWLIAQDSTGKRTSTSTYVGGVTDVVARIQRDSNGWNFSVWSYNGGSPVLLTTSIAYGPEVPAVPDNFAQMLTLGSFGYSSSTPMSGNFAYFRIYPTAVGATTAPLNALQTGALMAFEFDDNLVDTAVPARSLTPAGSGSISYTNTPQ